MTISTVLRSMFNSGAWEGSSEPNLVEVEATARSLVRSGILGRWHEAPNTREGDAFMDSKLCPIMDMHGSEIALVEYKYATPLEYFRSRLIQRYISLVSPETLVALFDRLHEAEDREENGDQVVI